MKLKKIKSLLAAAVIAIASLTTTGCIDIVTILFPELFGTIITVNATAVDSGAIFSWMTGSISDFRLFVDVVSQDGNRVAGYPKEITDGKRYVYVTGLQNGVSYTFTVSLYDSNGALVDSKSTSATPNEDSNTTHPYSSANADSIIKLDSNTGSITISGVNGKSLSYVNVNKSQGSAISSSAARKYISEYSSGLSASALDRTADDNPPQMDTLPQIKHFVPSDDKNITVIPPADRSGASTDTFNKANPQIGQTRTIYVDQDTAITRFAQEEMTLYAIGYEPGSNKSKIKCYVWANKANVVESGSANNKISVPVIQDIANKYISYYQLEEKIFGETSDKLLSSRGAKSMEDGPTGTAINIVLTDIGKDGTTGKCGVVGYFWAKDYAETGYSSSSAYKATNEGKYFYIDIPFCNYTNKEYKGVKQSGKEVASTTVLSTLFHEYQHMIDYNNKNIKSKISPASWYNEMLSMLCEDLLQKQMGIPDDQTIQVGRISNFNGYYYQSGITQYLDSNSWISYATAYAFGAWLSRNYGGAKLIHEMSVNSFKDTDSIVNAVNSVNGTNLTWNDLMIEYVKALGLRDAYKNGKSLPTLNTVSNSGYKITRDASTVWVASNVNASSSTDILIPSGTLLGYQEKGINLWSDKYRNSSGGSIYYGPLKLKVDADMDIQPTGFIFHPIGTANSDTVTLNFTSSTNSNEELYIFIQDAKQMTDKDSTAEVTANTSSIIWN